jgi:hypothetical protein
MNLMKIKEKAKYYFDNYDEYLSIVIAMELDWLELSDEELKVAIERIKYIYNHADYATIQGAATSYLKTGNIEFDENETEEENWEIWYEYSDWR